MTMTGLRVFDETLHTTHTWLHEVEARLGLPDRQSAYRLLRAALHTLRDGMEPNAVAHLSAQLPMLVRGFFYEGWRPAGAPRRRDRETMLEPVARALPPQAGIDPADALREVVAVMALHVSAGEMEDLRRTMPEDVRDLLTLG